jgi:hypothetical protein
MNGDWGFFLTKKPPIQKFEHLKQDWQATSDLVKSRVNFQDQLVHDYRRDFTRIILAMSLRAELTLLRSCLGILGLLFSLQVWIYQRTHNHRTQHRHSRCLRFFREALHDGHSRPSGLFFGVRSWSAIAMLFRVAVSRQRVSWTGRAASARLPMS